MAYNVPAMPEVPAYPIRLRDGALPSDMTRRRYHQCRGHFGLAVLGVCEPGQLPLSHILAAASPVPMALPASPRWTRERERSVQVTEACLWVRRSLSLTQMFRRVLISLSLS